MFGILDPIAWLSEQSIAALKWLAGVFTQLLLTPPRPAPGEWSNYLYGNGLGLGQYLAVFMAVVMTCLAVISTRGAGRAVHAILVGVVITALAPVYFALCDQLVAAGDTLVQAAQIAKTIGGAAPTVPDFGAPLAAIIGGVLIFPSGVILAAVIVGYELIIIIIKTFGLVVLALSPFNDAAQRRLELLVSLGIIAMVTGRPVAILITDLGTVVLNNTPLGSFGFSVAVILFAANVLAIWAQFWLLKKINQVVGNVSGRTLSSIRGSVDAVTRPASTANLESVSQANTRSLVPRQGQSRFDHARRAIRQEHTTRRNAALVASVATRSPQVQAAAAAYNRYRVYRANRS